MVPAASLSRIRDAKAAAMNENSTASPSEMPTGHQPARADASVDTTCDLCGHQHEREHDQCERGRREQEAGDVEPAGARFAVLAKVAQADRDPDQPDRQVDDEDPSPTRMRDEQTAEHRSER